MGSSQSTTTYAVYLHSTWFVRFSAAFDYTYTKIFRKFWCARGTTWHSTCWLTLDVLYADSSRGYPNLFFVCLNLFWNELSISVTLFFLPSFYCWRTRHKYASGSQFWGRRGEGKGIWSSWTLSRQKNSFFSFHDIFKTDLILISF